MLAVSGCDDGGAANDASVDAAAPPDATMSPDLAPTCAVAVEVDGGVWVNGPQHPPTPGCVACAQARCCDELTACAADSQCRARTECFAQCNDNLGFNNGCNGGHAADPTSDALDHCRDSKCTAACADWACLGSVTWPTPMSSTTDVNVVVQDFPSENGVAGALVRACSPSDRTCAHPVAMGTAQGNGALVLSGLPTSTAGIDVYLDITATNEPETLFYPYYVDRARFSTSLGGHVKPQLLSAATLAMQHVAEAPDRAAILFTVEDCRGQAGAGVTVAVDVADPMTRTYYVADDDSLSSMLTATGTNRAGVVLDVPAGAGAAKLTAKVAASGALLGNFDVVVRAGAATSINLVPTP